MPTAGAVQTGLSTLVQDTGQINSITITTPNYPVVVSAFTFQADQSTLDKIAGGFDVSDTAANLVAALSSLNADPRVDAITADIGSATLSGGVGVNAPSFSESGWGTSLTVSENLNYAGSFSEDAGGTFVLSGGQRQRDRSRQLDGLGHQERRPVREETLLHGGCEARVGAGERSITRHGRRWLARDRAYD